MISKFLWSIFGNDDEPVPPPHYLVAQPQWWRNFMWFVIRNPLHNFFFYRIGIEGKEGWTTTAKFTNDNPKERYAEQWPVSPSKVAWVLHKKGWVVLPFISIRVPVCGRGFEFYLGWRPRGSFGASLRLLKSRAV